MRIWNIFSVYLQKHSVHSPTMKVLRVFIPGKLMDGLKKNLRLSVKPPLHWAATFVPPLRDQKNGQDAQWSPKPRKFCFCVNATARPLCLPWMTKSAVMAQQVAQRRQSGGRTIAKVAERSPWSPNGGSVVATVIAQWTLSVRQRRHNGGTRKAEALLKLIHNVHNRTYF